MPEESVYVPLAPGGPAQAGLLDAPRGDLLSRKEALEALGPLFGDESITKDGSDLKGWKFKGSEAKSKWVVGRAVMEVAPGKARQRREQEAAKTRVERWAEASGNAGLAGRELPPAQVLAADQRVTAWARELEKAGLDGGMDALRARAFLDILLGMDSRPLGTTPGCARDPQAAARRPAPEPARGRARSRSRPGSRCAAGRP